MHKDEKFIIGHKQPGSPMFYERRFTTESEAFEYIAQVQATNAEQIRIQKVTTESLLVTRTLTTQKESKVDLSPDDTVRKFIGGGTDNE